MRKTLDFYFDFGSPTAYLAHKRLGQLSARYAVDVNYKAMLLGGVFKATGNTSPVSRSGERALHDGARSTAFCASLSGRVKSQPLLSDQHAQPDAGCHCRPASRLCANVYQCDV